MSKGFRPTRRRRSELATPASSEKMIAKAADSKADLIFLDLEDAVAPQEKQRARANVVEAFRELNWGNKARACRINAVETRWCYGDVIDVVSAAGSYIDILIIPKVKSPRDVWFVDDLLTQVELAHDLEVGRIGLEVLIEETEALARVDEIAASSPRLEALILGVGDLAASQGVHARHIGADVSGDEPYPYPGDIWHYARERMVVAARAHGLDPIDSPYSNFSDAEGYRRGAAWAATLGAVGKWCIHPSQIEIANESFSPSQDQIRQARKVVRAVEDAVRDGRGAASFDGVLIDAATSRIFQTVLDRAAVLGIDG